MIKYIDQQGFRVKIGIAYFFIFGGPGPDYTALVVEELNEDGTVSGYDPVFKIKVENIETDKL